MLVSSHLFEAGGVANAGVKAYSNTTIPAGNTIANTTAETTFSSTYTIPANTLAVGDVIEVGLFGVYSTAIVAPMVTGKVKFNTTAMSNTGAITAVAGVTNGGWFGTGQYLVLGIGASGSIDAQAFLEFQSAATTGLSVNVPNTTPITIDTTNDQDITVTVTWNAAGASNTITLRQMLVKKWTSP